MTVLSSRPEDGAVRLYLIDTLLDLYKILSGIDTEDFTQLQDVLADKMLDLATFVDVNL